jgi:two-component system, OmpR family, KDP operon response regulator KdpE
VTLRAVERERVLVVDDEPQILKLLSVALRSKGYVVEVAGGGEEALERLCSSTFDMLLLDLGLPDVDGLEVCRRLREWSQIPIIVISVREDDRDKVAALDLGADDYVTKPFSMDELLARMRANLRRSVGVPESSRITIGALCVDLTRRIVTRGDDEVHLTPTEYDLMRALTLHAGRVITHRQLLREARGPAYEEETPLLRVHMVALRQKLNIPANNPGHIVTEPGVGYRLLDQ